MLSFECMRNQQFADALVAAVPPSFKNSLQQMLQQAMSSARGGVAGHEKEDGASTAAAGGGAHGGTGGAAAGKTGAGGIARAEGAGGEGGQGLTGTAGGAGGTAAEGGGYSAVEPGGKAQGETVLEPTAARAAASLARAAASAEATPAADLLEASAASQLYSGLQGLCKRPGGLAALVEAEIMARNQMKPEPLNPEWLFSVQHADVWRRVAADTEGETWPPGRLIRALFQTAASFENVFRLVPDEVLFAGDAVSGKLLQEVRARLLVQLLSLDSIGDHEVTQDPCLVEITAGYIHSLNMLISGVWKRYPRVAVPVSFCCGNPRCRVMEGSSEVGLVMGAGASGARGAGGYCRGCKRMCYCSEACQREFWEGHKEVCSRYQEGKAAGDGQTANTSSSGSNAV